MVFNKGLVKQTLNDNEMSFKCYISYYDGNFLLSKHFLLVYDNQLLEMPWATGRGDVSQLVYLTPYPSCKLRVGGKVNQLGYVAHTAVNR